MSGAFSDGFQTTLSPQTKASAAFHAQTAPGKIKSRDDRDHAERMPKFSQRMVRALRYDRSAVELAGQPHRVVADVNHLLNFAETFRADLADFQRDEVREIGLVLAQFVSETADEFSAARRGRLTPAEKSLARFADGALRGVSPA